MFADARKLLFKHSNVWSKLDNPNFDVTMGLYNKAEVWGLVGFFFLDELAELLRK